MSTANNPDLPHKEDRIQFPKVIAVGVGALVCFALGIVWSTSIHDSIYVAAPVPQQVGDAEVGIVDQRLFTLDHRAQELKDKKRAHLGSYGWADREKSLGFIPIEQAMELVAAGKAGGEVPAQPKAPESGSEKAPENGEQYR